MSARLRHGRLLAGALLLAVACSAAEVVPVSTADELLAAFVSAAPLEAPSDTLIELQQDIALTQDLAANYTLPIVYETNKTVTIEGTGDGQLTSLDLGQIPSLLYFKAGATLVISRLNISNPADPQLGAFPDQVNSPTVIQSLPLWPTFGGDGGFTYILQDTNLTLHATELCTPSVLKAQISALQELAVSSDTGHTVLYTNGTTAYGTDLQVPVPVISRATRVALGTVNVTSINSQLHCFLPPNGADAGTSIVAVSTAEEFLSALEAAASPDAAGSTMVDLYDDVALTEEAAAAYSLPFVIASRHKLTIRGAMNQTKSLDLGAIPVMVYAEPYSTVTLDTLNISNPANPYYGSFPSQVDSPTVIQFMPLWPSFGGEPNFTFVMQRTNFTLYPSGLCNADNIASQAATLVQVAEAAGSSALDLTANGTMAYFTNWGSPIPVLNKTSKTSIGRMQVATKNCIFTCVSGEEGQPPAPAPAPSSTGGGDKGSSSSTDGGSSDGGGGGGGTPGWVWAVIAIAVVAAVCAALAGLLWRRRKLRKLQEQKLAIVTVQQPGPGGDNIKGAPSSELGSKSPHTTLGAASSDQLPSVLTPGGSSAMFDQLVGAKSGLPDGYEGYWKTRVGFIEGLQLGGLIGRGGYARVYKGRWKGTMVAVKVAATVVGPDQRLDLRAEPLLSLSLSHPNVLQSYKMCAVKIVTEATDQMMAEDPSPSASSGELGQNSNGSRGPHNHSGGSTNNVGKRVPHLTDPNCLVEVMPPESVLEPGMYEMWLVSELADKGTLADAMAAGRFTTGDPPARNIPMILLCMLDVARGLEYLHSCNIVHGDLKPQNVLLRTSGTDRRGFVCKLGDFGLSRMLSETETHVQTGSYGTVTYAAPELLKQGRLTKASDIFAFAMVLWELVTGERLFPQMHQMTIIVQVTQHGFRPPIAEEVPKPLADLLRRCWAENPSDRPSAAVIVQELISFSSTLATQKREAAGSNSTSMRQLNLRPAEGATPPSSFRQQGAAGSDPSQAGSPV